MHAHENARSSLKFVQTQTSLSPFLPFLVLYHDYFPFFAARLIGIECRKVLASIGLILTCFLLKPNITPILAQENLTDKATLVCSFSLSQSDTFCLIHIAIYISRRFFEAQKNNHFLVRLCGKDDVSTDVKLSEDIK